MAEDLIKLYGTKKDVYHSLLPQIKALVEGESDRIANLANTCAALKTTFGFLWVGFYIVHKEELVLGPFQGPIACTRIKKGKGVCGTSWEKAEAIIVADVDTFPGHIACSSMSKSEIVVPLIKNNEVIAVLDVDSDTLDFFDEIDLMYLTELCAWLSEKI